MSKTLMTSVAAAALVFSLAACADGDPEGAEGTEAPAEAGQEQSLEGAEGMGDMPEPDLEGIPDVVAEVNGEEISGEDFTQIYEQQFAEMAMQSQLSGEEVDEDELKNQTLDSMIGNELLIQDAADRGLDASEDEVNELLEEFATQSGSESVDDFIATLEEEGTSEEVLRESAEQQVMINKLQDELDVEEPSDEELRDMYDEIVAQQEEAQEGQEESEGEEEAAEIPEFEEVRDDLKDQEMEQAQLQALSAHAEELREDADVEVLL